MRSPRESLGAGRRSRIRTARMMGEAVGSVSAKKTRSVLTVFGTLLGVGSFVTVLGLTSTANSQIAETFTAEAVTQVKLTHNQVSTGSASFNPSAERAVRSIRGVKAAGVYWVLNNVSVSLLPGQARDASQSDLRVSAASQGFWDAVEPQLLQGRIYDDYLSQQPVAVIGEEVALNLGIGDLSERPLIYLSDKPYAVIGIVETVSREQVTAGSIVVPDRNARRVWGRNYTDQMIISTQVGAGAVVAEQAPTAAKPFEPGSLSAQHPPDSTRVEDAVSTQLRGLFLALALVCLVIGGIGIANVNLISVLERVSEIGLRRAMGAMPRHIIAQLLIEASVLGALGGLLGGVVGQSIVVIVSLQQQWTPTIAPWSILISAPAGLIISSLAALYPAWKAARIEPVEAFRYG